MSFVLQATRLSGRFCPPLVARSLTQLQVCMGFCIHLRSTDLPAELCYLTQIVLRVFEDSTCEISDPKRFRVEILFSPGATATPLHLDETVRDSDSTRFDTAPLQVVGRDDLTCAELEQFFAEAIADGKGDDDSDEGVVAPSTASLAEKKMPPSNPTCLDAVTSEAQQLSTVAPSNNTVLAAGASVVPESKHRRTIATEKGITQLDDSSRGDPLDRSEVIRRVLARKHVWSAVAIGSIVLGAGLILLAMRQSERPPRRWETKRI